MGSEKLITGKLKTVDNYQISYDHYKNGHDKVVIIAHGYFSSSRILLFKELGYELSDQYDVIIFDFRGHGNSSGLFYWTSKEHQDLEAILQYAKTEYEHIGVIGFSLGAATSIITASKTKIINSLIAVSGPSQFNIINYHFWRINFETDIVYNLLGKGRIGKGVRPGPMWLKKEKPIDLVDKINIPVFYIHGDADWLIRPIHSKRLFEKTKGKKKIEIIKKGLHAEFLIRKNKEDMIRIIKEWFKETL